MERMARSRLRAERVSYLYVCALVVVLYLFLPCGGYERMMAGKYACYIVLTLGWLAAMLFVMPLQNPRVAPMRGAAGKPRVMALAAAAYFGCSALSALLSPYGTRTLLGGTRRDGLVTLALYVVGFFLLSRYLRADRKLLYLAAGGAALCDVLTLIQLAGYDPLRLYPAGTGYFDGDAAYAGFYAGTSGNIDFTAFLLAFAVCLFAFALVRLRLWALAPAAALTLFALYRLGVAAAWAGLACAAVWGLTLLLPRRKKAALLASMALTAAALLFVWSYGGANRPLTEASLLLRGEADGSFGSGRLAIWRACVPLIRERPLFGGGPDTLWLRGLEPFAWDRGGGVTPLDITAAHNEYLNILVNQGALALAAYLTLLGCALTRCFRRAREPRFALCGAGLLCYAAMACFSISTCITAPYVWLLLAIAGTDKNPFYHSCGKQVSSTGGR